MNSAYLGAVIGAVAGLVTGLGSALIALRVARSQDASARELQRRQWRADTLRDCYSQVGGTHRRFMLAWLGWWDEYNADRKREQHAELMQAASAFAAACTAVRIYAPEYVVELLMNLRKLTLNSMSSRKSTATASVGPSPRKPSTTNCVPRLTTRCRRSSAPLASASKKYSAAPSADPHGPAAWWATWPGEATPEPDLPHTGAAPLRSGRYAQIFGREDVDSASVPALLLPALLSWFWPGAGVGSGAWVPA
jgi:hypothetical protein